ncbi:hypothetical protein B0H17DRAFT_1197050 [Mycena rosella]|uniref:Ankyrin repeat domain-containing protein n=1 Tax=Mycena rosella TaxID=1033263 RepID=A0AAD7DSE3_MYCRO|nr:hypothetical protein B0H17DRAFT_1197050 [Mycena rosella]
MSQFPSLRHLRELLQPDFEARLTPELRETMLHLAAAAKPHIVIKLLSPPHSMSPETYGEAGQTPLHVAADARNLETAALLLDAGANPGAEIEMIQLLLDRGADLKLVGGHSHRPTVGVAVDNRWPAIVRLLIDRGADASVTVPIYVGSRETSASLPYLAMDLQHLTHPRAAGSAAAGPGGPKFEGPPLSNVRKQLMALLIVDNSIQKPRLQVETPLIRKADY